MLRRSTSRHFKRPNPSTTTFSQRYVPRQSHSTQQLMSFVYSIDRKVSYKQNKITEQLGRHLIKNGDPLNLAPGLLLKGFCCGLTAYALHALWLEPQPHRYDINNRRLKRLDATWYWSFLKTLSNWKSHVHPAPELEKNLLNSFAYKLNLFQHDHTIGHHIYYQGDYEVAFAYMLNAHIKREYSLVAALNAHDFLRPILLKNGTKSTNLLTELIKPERMVLIIANEHATGLFLYGDRYYFYDCNNHQGLYHTKVSSADELVDTIFKSHILNPKKSELFILRMFASPHLYAHYPKQNELLSALTAVSELSENHKQPIYYAAAFNCSGSVNYYLEKKVDVNLTETKFRRTNLHVAAFHNAERVVKELLAQPDIDISLRDAFNQTAADLAVSSPIQDLIRGHATNINRFRFFPARKNAAELHLDAKSLTLKRN